MTDHDPLLDELASAHLDGTTSAEESARVEADPALRARVEELGRVRAALGEAPAVDPARREMAIAAALAAFDEQPDHSEVSTSPAPVTLVTAVAAARRSSPIARRLVGVAAAFLLLALLVPLLAGRGGGGDDEEASDAATAIEETGGELEAGAEDSNGGASPESSAVEPATTTSSRAAAPGDLGSFDELESLVDAATAGDVEASAPVAGTLDTSAAGDCATALLPGSRPATATLAGEAVLVVITPEADGTRTLRIFAGDACNLLVERSL